MTSDSREDSKPVTHAGTVAPDQQLETVKNSLTGCHLLMLQGPSQGALFRLTGETVTIGRADEAAVFVDDQSVSSHHAKLLARGGQCWVADLNSTNGTFLNQVRVMGAVELRVGDSLRVGSIVFAFLAENEDSRNNPVSASRDHSGTLTRTSSLQGLPIGPPPRGTMLGVPPAKSDDEGPSLLDWVLRLRTAYRFVKAYSWLLVTCTCLGLAGGVLYSRLKPPPGSAWFEISLLTEARANPMERANGEQVIFVAASNAFLSAPLLKRTMQELHYPDVSDEMVSRAKNRLSFETMDRWGKVWRGEYEDKTAESARRFLQTHLDIYLDSEINKTLQLIQAQDLFLAKQLDEAKANLTGLEGRMAAFRREHPEILPLISDVEVPAPSETVGSAKATASKSLQATRAEIARLREQMNKGDSLLVDRVKDAEKYRTQIAAVESKIAQAKANGLTEQHPTVTGLRSQVRELQTLVDRTVAAETTEVAKRTNTEYRKMRERLQQLENEEAGKREQLKGLDHSLKEIQREEMSLPELETRYREMAREHENAASLYQALSTKKSANELQLELERAAASSRYNVITPPTAEPPDLRTNLIKSLAIGGILGVLVAIAIVVLVELRKLFQWAALQPNR